MKKHKLKAMIFIMTISVMILAVLPINTQAKNYELNHYEYKTIVISKNKSSVILKWDKLTVDGFDIYRAKTNTALTKTGKFFS